MATAAEVRQMVLDMIEFACSHSFRGEGPVEGEHVRINRGPNWVRRGRWVICDTDVANLLIVVEVARDLRSCSVHLGPPSRLRNVVPPAVRNAWIAAQYGERDSDP